MANAALAALNIEELRAIARRRLPRIVFDFLDDGAEDNVSLHRNRRVFDEIRLRPRTLVNVSSRPQAITVFGRPWSMPVAIGPTGIAGLIAYEADIALARAAGRMGVPFVLSTASTVAMEDVRAASDGIMWFQLYMSKDREAARALVDRARVAGYEALVVTTDVVVLGNRERNFRNGFRIPFQLRGANMVDGLLHPRWLFGVLLRSILTSGMPRFRNLDAQREGKVVIKPDTEFRSNRTALDWDDVRWLRDIWPGKLLVKGILHPQDAIAAADCGADGIFVTNHGGRQLDGAVSPIEALPAIVSAVGKRLTIVADSGFRRGTDVVKALALGAQAVFTGRVTLYGAVAGGEDGAAHALGILQSEIDRVLALLGCPGVEALGHEFLECPHLIGGPPLAHSWPAHARTGE